MCRCIYGRWPFQDGGHKLRPTQGIAKLVEDLPRSRFQLKWNWSYLLNFLGYLENILHTNWYWQTPARSLTKSHFHTVSYRMKLVLTLEPCVHFDKILHTYLLWQDLPQRGCQMQFANNRGFAEFPILEKKILLALTPELYAIFW